jgi:vacuolar-type H+-ATPase subunit B/Vma2
VSGADGVVKLPSDSPQDVVEQEISCQEEQKCVNITADFRERLIRQLQAGKRSLEDSLKKINQALEDLTTERIKE